MESVIDGTSVVALNVTVVLPVVIEDMVDVPAVVILLSADVVVNKVVGPGVMAAWIPLMLELRVGEAVVKIPSLVELGVPSVVTSFVKDPTLVDDSEFVSSSKWGKHMFISIPLLAASNSGNLK
ncbi:unnamed protein product [Orchesella dallaii]|uniref:Uncharacterized protein n=1 Tax=Orchesella dallaii TaxID=48710 RepID=A0ABP1R5Y5_9HEXA